MARKKIIESSTRDQVVDYNNFTTQATPKSERDRLGVGDWYINAVECTKCGDTPRSRNRHDFRYCKCGSIAVDGGSWYLRRVGDLDRYIDKSVRYDDAKESENA